MSSRNSESINFWKQKADEIRVQMNLGAAEAADKYEEEKKIMREWIHDTEQNIKKSGDNSLNTLREKLEELKLQAALGKAEANDAIAAQRKKLNKALHEAQIEANRLSQEADEKSEDFRNRISENLNSWQTKFDIFQLQLNLGAKEAEQKWQENKGKFKEWLNDLDDNLDSLRDEGKDSWKSFKAEMTNSWNKFKSGV